MAANNGEMPCLSATSTPAPWESGGHDGGGQGLVPGAYLGAEVLHDFELSEVTGVVEGQPTVYRCVDVDALRESLFNSTCINV